MVRRREKSGESIKQIVHGGLLQSTEINTML